MVTAGSRGWTDQSLGVATGNVAFAPVTFRPRTPQGDPVAETRQDPLLLADWAEDLEHTGYII